MNQASRLTNERELYRAAKKERFLKLGSEKKEIIGKGICCFRQSHPPEGNGKGLSVNFLVLTKKFYIDWLKVTFLGG